ALKGEASPFSELPIQYADYAGWQRARLAGAALEAQLGWWGEQLAGIPTVLELPADRPRPPLQSLRGAVRSFALPPELSQRLRGFVRREGATLFMAVLAADLRGEPDFRELVARARRASLGAFAHAEVPFERLVEALGAQRDLSRPPLFQVMLAYQNAPLEAVAVPGLTLSPLPA